MRVVLFTILLVTLLPTQAAEEASHPVLVITRHAEKVAGDDPCLNETGRDRAVRLMTLLTHVEISRLLSTDYCRTRETLQPLAAQRGLEIEEYSPLDADEIRDALDEAGNSAVVVAGHSNTVPALLRALGADAPDISEREYDNLFIVTFNKEKPLSVVRLTY